MTEKIPGFYYDLIVRIAPGGLLIVIYYGPAIQELAKHNEGSWFGVIGSFAGLVCSYILGYVLETIASGIDVVHQQISKRTASGRLFGLLPSNEIWKSFAELEKESPNKELFSFKEMAERALFRTLLVVSSTAVLLELVRIRGGPDILHCIKATVPPLSAVWYENLYLLISVGASISSLVTFIKIWYFLGKRVKPRKPGSRTERSIANEGK